MKKIHLIGQFSPPIHGLSKALDTIKNSEDLNKKFDLTHVNITNNKKFFMHLKNIRMTQADIYYFTISHSLFGNVRDLIILRELVRKKRKIIIHYHGGYFKKLYEKMNFFQKEMNKALFKKVDTVVVLSKGLHSLFSGLVEESKIKICENYVEDQSLLSLKEFNEKTSDLIDKENIEILYLSNFIKSKGYEEVLKTAAFYQEEKMRFHFAGKFFSAKEQKEFQRFIAEKKLTNVTYHGIVDGRKKKELIKQSDVFILPTYYQNEGQPISLIEAMANGLTVITTKHAGIPDIVTKENGYLINPKNVLEIKQALDELNKDRTKLVDFAYQNRKYALHSFKESDYINRLEKLFNEV